MIKFLLMYIAKRKAIIEEDLAKAERAIDVYAHSRLTGAMVALSDLECIIMTQEGIDKKKNI